LVGDLTSAQNRTVDMRPTLSVVVPMYNEAEVLPELFLQTRAVLDDLGVDYELVCVDDGSSDDTAALVQAATYGWSQLRLVRLVRNSGHQAALTAGYERARGDFVVTMDADLQDPPSVIAEMLRIARAEQVDVVYGVREDRSADSFLKRRTAGLYYKTMRRLAGNQVTADVGDFRLVTRRVIEALERVPEHTRVYRLIIPWYGFPSAEVRYCRAARAAGKTKYPISKMVALAVDSVTTFSAAPLRVATAAGVFGVLVCLTAMAVSIIAWATENTVPGWTSTVATVGLIGAIQLICVGLLGEYMARLFIASQGRPSYIVGFDTFDQDAASRPSEPVQPETPLVVPGRAGDAQRR
jgi:glycosyltransferase involved in cell wall biosynthesis